LALALARGHKIIIGLAFGGLGLECCGLGLAGQVLALALADAVKLRYTDSNI